MKKKALRLVAGLAAVVLLFLMAAPSAWAEQPAPTETDAKKVAFISSYSLSFPTVERQIEGIQEVFEDENVNLSYEFMDTKELDSEQDIREFLNYLTYKWDSVGKPDLVIVGDDSALELVLEQRDGLFSQMPVIFESIDDSDRARRAHEQNMTGILESGPLRANIDLARSIYPDAGRVLAVVDDSPSGKGAAATFLSLQSEYPDVQLALFNTSQMTADEIATALQGLDTDTILLYYIFSVDGTQKKYTTAESAKLLFSNAAVPVFYYQIGVGTGSLGGVQVDFTEMGRMAARMALRALEGTACRDIPVVWDTPTALCFDAAVMKRFSIPKSKLPKNAVYINDDTEAQVRLAIRVLSGVAVALLALMSWLWVENCRRSRREAQLLKNQTTLQRLAEHDALTSLCNRRRFYSMLDDRVARSQPTTLLSFDIDYFKQINDTYGHQAGDAVLIEMGVRMRALRDENIAIFRYGGDEFAAIVTSADRQTALHYSQRIREAFAAPFPLEEGKEIPVSISLGFARYPEDGQDRAGLIACADAALYSVKQNGRDGIQSYSELAH